MQYRKNPKNGEEISQLGFGCMRFPRKTGSIDQAKTTELIKAAIDGGINYFDTAYIYPGSESALGTALAELGQRDNVKIATKLPLFLVKTNADFDKYFNAALERLQTDRIDYYLMHMLCDVKRFESLKKIGLIEWIEEKKKQGKIINIGFSYHGGRDEFKRVLDAYDWEFVQIQYNYYDENNQAGREGLEYASAKGLPVFIMEPLRGGMLVKGLTEEAKKVLHSANENRSYADWALRWLWNQPKVTMLLSGMTKMSELEENLKLAGGITSGCISDEEMNVYKSVNTALAKSYKVPCTGCGYCLPCPMGVDIPTCFRYYNESFTGRNRLRNTINYGQNTGAYSAKQSNASKCAKCGKCEKHCPQHIEISKRLEDVTSRVESFWFRPTFALLRIILGYK